MREKMLAINSQNIYAKNTEKIMVDAQPRVEEKEVFSGKNQALAKTEEAQKAAEKAIKEAAQGKLAKAKGLSLPKEANPEEATAAEAAPKVEITAYFPQPPSNPAVYKEAQVSYETLGRKPLETIDTTRILKCYMRLKSVAEAQGENNLLFLSEIKRELENRGVNPNAVYQASKEAYTAALRQEWRKRLTDEEKRNPDVLSSIELAAEQGLMPKITPREKVLAHSELSDKERIEEAEKILRRSLSEEEKEAILEAHYAGSGEKSVDGNPAGVYNYTREQLAQKAEILKAAGFTKEQRRTLVEAGIAAEPIDATGITHTALTPIISQLETEARHLRDKEFDPDDLGKYISRVEGLIDRGGVFTTPDDLQQALTLIDRLKPRRIEAYRKEYERRKAERPEGLWQTLKEEDFELLRSDEYEDGKYKNLDKFVNKWFDTLYAAAGTRDASQSPAFTAVSRADEEASVFLSSIEARLGAREEEKQERREKNAKKLEYLSDLFETRIRLLTMNSAISSKSIESIQKGSYGLRAHGLLKGVSLDRGYTGALFNRMTELLEDERLKSMRGHMTPDLTNKIQDMVIAESLALGEKGVGLHAGKSRADIERAVRSAYDMLVCSQRMHIIAARGKELFRADAFFSDAGAAFKAFNPKTFVSEKWGIFTPTDQRFLREVMEKSLIDEWLEEKRETYPELTLTDEQRKELGDLLFKTMDSPPDFFSSGWRIKGMKDQLQNYFTYRAFVVEAQARGLNPQMLTRGEWDDFKQRLRHENDGQKIREIMRITKSQAEDFGLFIRLKTASGSERLAYWEKIQKYRPEEIIRLLREKYKPEEMDKVNEAIFHGIEYTDERGDRIKIKSYDDFKEKFGASLRTIRELGFQRFEQIDFANITDQQAQDVLLGEEKKQLVREVYQRMQNYISANKIVYVREHGKLTSKGSVIDKDCRFADLYDKTLVTDDILLERLEVLDQPQRNSGMIELSRLWSSDLGGDGFVRNMNDLASAHAYTDELVGFVKETNEEEKFKHAEAAASKASDYNGRGGQAKALRHTIIPYMWASMPPGFYDTLGIKQLPFRIKMTKIEDIYGPHAKPLTQDERREMLDKIETRLEAAIQNELDQLQFELEENKRKLQNLDPLAVDYEEQKEKLEHAIGEYPKEVREARERGLRYRHSAEKLLQVRTRDLFRQKAITLLIFLMLAGLAEGVKMLQPGKG